MPTKRCQWATCNSDNRYRDRAHMQGVTFHPFVKPKKDRERCLRWIQACGRPPTDLYMDRIKGHSFICSKHFVNGKGPTEEDPDPIPADPVDLKYHGRKGRKGPAKISKSLSNRNCSESKRNANEAPTCPTSADEDAARVLLSLATPLSQSINNNGTTATEPTADGDVPGGIPEGTSQHANLMQQGTGPRIQSEQCSRLIIMDRLQQGSTASSTRVKNNTFSRYKETPTLAFLLSRRTTL